MAMNNRENFGGISEITRARYLRNLASQIDLLRQAMEKSEYESVREICHRVRGSASLFGLKDLGDACRDMEEACIKKNVEAIVSGYQSIEVIARRHLPSAEAS